jgi:Xaa-Pro aminopeptidase
MELAAWRGGAEEMSFGTIIASGPRAALPHGRASTQEIASGAFVVCDFGVILSGYCSDQTRTVWVGDVTNDARSAYEAVKEAQQAAVEAVRPGISTGEVDAAARKVLRKAGLRFTKARAWQTGSRKSCSRGWSSLLSREYTSPASGA